MKQIPILACLASLFILLQLAKSDEELVRDALLGFFSKLSNNKSISIPGLGWNASSFPCSDGWRGITCLGLRVERIDLDGFDLEGVFDPGTLCNVHSLSESILNINISKTGIHGENLDDIKNCYKLTHLDISWNRISGQLPGSISELKNLQILDLSHNEISGSLPDLSQMHRLTVFLAQENEFSGSIPELDFSKFREFNVSHNFLTGPIPGGAHGLPLSSFLDNLKLCGPPLPDQCPLMASEESAPEAPPPPLSPPEKLVKKGLTNNQILMYIGYVFIGCIVLFLILLWLRKRAKKTRREAVDADNGVAALDDSMIKPSFSTVELKAGGDLSKAEYSTASAESGVVSSSSLTVLTNPDANGLRFEDLLKAPAELLGRGSHGSVYKVVCEALAMTLAVKRIKDWPISSSEFRQRMRRLSQVKHSNVLPAIAYYISGQEKLLVYEYQHNGSLFRHIHANGNENRQALDWSSRLSIAATVAETLSYMHDQLQYDRIPHGNLKSSNILMNTNMEACISEYGLMQVEGEDRRGGILVNAALQAAQEDYKAIFKMDTYRFGVVLLELLTGRMALSEGLDLASWVVSVVREEWTVEVFDKNLIREGVSEERMVNVLQIAIKCVAAQPQARPSMRQVALAIGSIREEDERSLDVSVTRSFAGL